MAARRTIASLLSLIKRPVVGAATWVVRTLARHGVVWPWPQLCARNIVELANRGRAEDDRIVLLALLPRRFLGDLKALAETGEFRIIWLKTPWQGRINRIFGECTREPGRLGRVRPEFEPLMANFLKAFQRRTGVDVVIGAAFWYRMDIPWGSTAQKVGIPYVVLHKENLKTQPPQQKWIADMARRAGRFSGHHVIVHNRPIKDLLVNAGFADAGQVTSCGCLRMDAFVRDVAEAGHGNPGRRSSGRDRQKVSLFSFSTGIGLNDLGVRPLEQQLFIGWYRLFERVHAAFADLTLRTPSVDFVIKPKWGGPWLDLIDRALEANGLNARKIPNLTIDCDVSPHDLILSSDVVCGFASTTLLEAGIARKPVIVPHFEEPTRPPYSERVSLKAYYDLFDVADSPETFAQFILRRLDDPFIPEDCLERRREAFDTWISDLSGNATQQYVEVLKAAAEWGRNRRREIAAAGRGQR